MCAIVTTCAQSIPPLAAVPRRRPARARIARAPVGRYGGVNALDLLLILLVALSGVAGYRRGITLQAFGFGGLLIGLVAGALLAPFIAHFVGGPNARAGLAVLILLTVAALGN